MAVGESREGPGVGTKQAHIKERKLGNNHHDKTKREGGGGESQRLALRQCWPFRRRAEQNRNFNELEMQGEFAESVYKSRTSSSF